MKPESFYVMVLIEGDECLLFNRSSLAEAREAARAEMRRDSRTDLSIWSSKGGIIDMRVTP